MRSDKKGELKSNEEGIIPVSGQYLTEAVEWFNKNGIELHGIQSNPDQKTWTDSPKSYAELMIDDSALGCPLKYDRNVSSRPFVDWDKVEWWLESRGII